MLALYNLLTLGHIGLLVLCVWISLFFNWSNKPIDVELIMINNGGLYQLDQIRTYSSINLLKFNHPVQNYLLPTETLHTIRNLGINKFTRTKRGRRAGSRKIKTIPVITVGLHKPVNSKRKCKGPCFQSLIPINVSPPQSLTAGVINAQSVCNKTDDITSFVLENNLDILAISETWLCEGDTLTQGDLTPCGYTLLHVPRHGRRGGGVAVLYRSYLCIRKSILPSFKTFECLEVTLTCKSTATILVVYRPPSTLESQFLQEFSSLLSSYTTRAGSFVIVGDFNIHWDCKVKRNVINFSEILSMFGFLQHVDSPTHEHGHIIDLVITHENDSVVSNVTTSTLISDHHAVLFKMNVCKPTSPNITRCFRKISSVDMASFREQLSSSDLAKCRLDCPNVGTDQLNNVLRELLDAHAPLSEKVVSNKHSVPWYTLRLREAKRMRRKLERKWRSTGLVVHREMFKDQRNLVRKLLFTEKQDYYQTKIHECRSDQRQLNKIVAKLTHGNKPLVLPTCSSSLSDLLTQFGQFFIGKIDKIRNKLDSCIQSTPKPVIVWPETTAYLRIFAPASEDEVLKIITRSPKKTCSLDPIPVSMMIECLPELISAITGIINSSLASGIFPSSMKKANIVPLLKKPNLDKEVLGNYRPVANLTFLSKILERVVAYRIKDHLCKNNLYEPYQSAYRECHSTESALLKVNNDLLLALDNRCVAYLVLLDLSAAFDTIDHEILISRLRRQFGIQDIALEWLISYLSDRTQAVTVMSTSSPEHNVTIGVPQGSVLGPLLFTLYTSEITSLAKRHNVSVHLFADDTQIYTAFRVTAKEEAQTALLRIEKCISEVQSWMIHSKLQLNPAKTEFLVVMSPHLPSSFNAPHLRVGDSLIQPSVVVRNLGVLMDKHLTMQSHINQVCRSCYYHLKSIGRIRNCLTKDAAATLVHGLVASRVDYGNSLLFNLPSASLAKLQRVLNTAARMVSRTKRFEPITPVLQDLHWLKIQERIKFKLLVITFKALQGQAPAYIKELLVPYIPPRSLRSLNENFLVIPTSRVRYGDRAFSVAAPSLWNKLPGIIRNMPTLESFRRGLKTHLFNVSF